MATNVKEYVKLYLACRQIKSTRHLPHSKLQSLLLLIKPRQDWMMDFITGVMIIGADRLSCDPEPEQ